MTDYHPLIARAVEGLDRSTGEARRALYERARNALVAQLRSNQISEADINKERLALEKAIRKVEAEAARKSRSESRSDPRATTPPATTPEGGAQVRRASGAARERADPPPADLPRTAVLPSARDRLLSARSSLKKQGAKGCRDSWATYAKHTRQRHRSAPRSARAREAPELRSPQYPPSCQFSRLRYAAGTQLRSRLQDGRRALRPRTSGPLLAAQRGGGRRKRSMNGTARRSRDFSWC